jgi:hypothetical protein
VRRSLAALLIVALVAVPAAVATLHTHDYAEHDHPEHHHGPSSHEHGHPQLSALAAAADHAVADVTDPPVARLESCDPGGHVAAVTFNCAPAPQLHLTLAEVSTTSRGLPVLRLSAAVGLTDVRVHGPPGEARIPARAPPLTPLA